MNDCIVMVDDDPEDRILAKTALQRTGLPIHFLSLSSGESLLDFFHQKTALNGVAAQTDHAPIDTVQADNRSDYLVLLDLNMPKMDGRVCLTKLRELQGFDALPVVVFSTSDAYDDIGKSYAAGANSYVCKPDNVTELESAINGMCRFWLMSNKAAVGE